MPENETQVDENAGTVAGDAVQETQVEEWTEVKAEAETQAEESEKTEGEVA